MGKLKKINRSHLVIDMVQLTLHCECSLVVKSKLPKLVSRVRFPSLA